MSLLQNKIDESERKYEEISKERIKEEVPEIDQSAIIKLEAEKQQLKVGFLDTDSLIHNLSSYKFRFFLLIIYI